MSGKRPRHDDEQARSDGNNPLVRKQKKGRIRGSVAVEAKEELLSSMKSLLPELLPELVRKEVERLRPEHCTCKIRCCANQMDNSASRSLQLEFINKLTLPNFTMENVKGEDSSFPSIALVDAQTGQIVKSGPESLMNFEMVLLQGHFKGNDDGNWTSIQFSNHIVRERKDKRPLLIGDVSLTMNKGIAVAHELKITDNSRWTWSGAFRLAARVGDGYFDGMRIKEAITEPFMVKEKRGKSYQKKHPPSLDDEVWSLEEIGRDGNIHKRLQGENINTVKDFLIKLHADTQGLQNILGFRNNDKRWEVIKRHAEECDLDSKTYVYYSKAEWVKGVVFNIVGAVKGFLFEERFIPINELPDIQKVKKEVKKELKKKFGRFLRKYRASEKRLHVRQMRKSASRTLQLKFRDNISLPIFTLTEIEGKDPSALTIALVDAMTRQVVNSGPESSMKVEIVILEGNFKGDEDNNWTFEHFSNNIVREGKDNQTLLTGDVFLTLNEGIGVASKLKITDNSSRTKKRKFRLAARVPDVYFNGMRVKEAITEPFTVKERRGKSYMKKHPPSLDDEVWRLEKIGKELSKRLSSENVNTVKDFLLMLHADTPRLLKILGLTMNDKRWEVIKNHAEECDPINDHPDIQKVEMQQMIKVAYEHWREVDPYADGPILGSSPNVALDSFPDVSTRPENPTDIFRSSQLPNLTTSPSDFPHSGNMEFDFDYFWYEPELQADHGNTSSSFSKVSTQSVAVTWTTLITVMKFSKRIAALKDRSDARS